MKLRRFLFNGDQTAPNEGLERSPRHIQFAQFINQSAASPWGEYWVRIDRMLSRAISWRSLVVSNSDVASAARRAASDRASAISHDCLSHDRRAAMGRLGPIAAGDSSRSRHLVQTLSPSRP